MKVRERCQILDEFCSQGLHDLRLDIDKKEVASKGLGPE